MWKIQMIHVQKSIFLSYKVSVPDIAKILGN